MSELHSGMLLGLLLGMRHALEPDHLMAVSNLVLERRSEPKNVLLLGVEWGIGHTGALFLVALILSLLRTQMPVKLGEGLEILVALMLMVLGSYSLYQAFCSLYDLGDLDTLGRRRRRLRRPLFVGLIHGLAGSGAITSLILVNLGSLAAQLTYVLLFGFGSILSMALLSFAMGMPVSWLVAGRLGQTDERTFGATKVKNEKMIHVLGAALGVGSVVMGFFVAVRPLRVLFG